MFLLTLRFFLKWLVCISLISTNVWSFECKTPYDAPFGDINGVTLVKDVTVDVVPAIGNSNLGNLVVNLASSISCRNTDPTHYYDFVSVFSGSTFGNILTHYNGSIVSYGASSPFPVTNELASHNFTNGSFQPWDVQLYLSPVGAAGGLSVPAGTTIAVLTLKKLAYNFVHGYDPILYIQWNIKNKDNIVIPTGGCDVSSRNVTVNLPDYPGGTTPIPLTISCPSGNQNLAYYLTGTTTNAANGNNIFSNTAGSSPAQGVGVQISNANGVIVAGSNISLGTVGASAVSLGLTANYATTGGQVIAGNVQSIIGVTFIYQ